MWNLPKSQKMTTMVMRLPETDTKRPQRNAKRPQGHTEQLSHSGGPI